MTQHLIDALDIAAADAEMYGQRLQSALARAWTAAQDGDDDKLEDAILTANREDFHLRGIMLNVRDALLGLERSEPTKLEALTEALTKEEIRELIMALGEGQPAGFSDGDAEALVDWAKKIRINGAMLSMLLDHRLTASIDPDGDVLMSLPKGGKP